MSEALDLLIFLFVQSKQQNSSRVMKTKNPDDRKKNCKNENKRMNKIDLNGYCVYTLRSPMG